MLTLKIGIQTASLRLPFKKALHVAAELGASAIEIDARTELRPGELSQTGLRQFRKMLEDLNLKVSAVSFQTRRGYDTEQNLERRIAATKEAMQLAYAVGASVVINSVGPVPEPPAAGETKAAWNCLTEALTDLGRHGDVCGAQLAATTGTESGERLKMLLEVLPVSALRVNFDPGRLIINGFSASDSARQLGAAIAHVHVNDAVRDLAQGRGLSVPLGRGSVDYPEILAELENHDYRGYLTVERQESEDPLVEIGQAVQYLKNLD